MAKRAANFVPVAPGVEPPALAELGMPPRFSLVTAADLAKPVPDLRWLVRGVWPEKSHGPLAGAKKSLKSWNALALAIAIASGKPYLGKFDVETTGPVLYLNGEGGQVPYARRFQRLTSAYGVDGAGLPLYATFGVGPLDGAPFRREIRAHLDALRPALVILDPLYVYHPTGIEAQNLYERGRMLGELSSTIGHETALIVVDHYRKTGGKELDLDEIGQSGVAQWADSWILQAHRELPNLEAGSFRLAAEHGSRQWGGRRWNVDWDCGAWDPDAGEPAGEIGWTVEAADGLSGTRADRKPKLDPAEWEAIVLEWIESHPPTTKTKVIGALTTEYRVGEKAPVTAFNELDRKGQIATEKAVVEQANGPKTQTVWVSRAKGPRIRVSTASGS